MVPSTPLAFLEEIEAKSGQVDYRAHEREAGALKIALDQGSQFRARIDPLARHPRREVALAQAPSGANGWQEVEAAAAR